jgi:NADPH2:quinone reductase
MRHDGCVGEGFAGGIRGVDADLVAVKPANLTMREATSLSLVATTAWGGPRRLRAPKRAQLVLVHGVAEEQFTKMPRSQRVCI